MRTQHCPKCEGAMTRGFLLGHKQGYHAVGEWIEGEPVKSLWTGLRLGGRTRHRIESWRCGRCGYLESYAR